MDDAAVVGKRCSNLSWGVSVKVMAKNERQMARKPATKFPNLRKKLEKSKIQSKQVKKK
jgi:hypothetical protein